MKMPSELVFDLQEACRGRPQTLLQNPLLNGEIRKKFNIFLTTFVCLKSYDEAILLRLHKDSVGGGVRVDPLPYLPTSIPTTHFRSIPSVTAHYHHTPDQTPLRDGVCNTRTSETPVK